jgi:hypothetical protein
MTKTDTKQDHYLELLGEFHLKWKSKDSPPLTARQIEQFNWLFEEIWKRAQDEVRKP